MEQEHTKPTSNWQEFWQILRHGQFGKLFAGATENTLIQFFRYCFVGGAATVVDWGISALLFFAVFDQHYAILANGCSFVRRKCSPVWWNFSHSPQSAWWDFC